jgi:hypothetical protein
VIGRLRRALGSTRAVVGLALLVLLAVAGLLALAVAMAATTGGQTVYALLGARIDEIVSWVTGFFTDPRPEALAPALRWPFS